jgi:molybdopterin adenylyltransferase
MIEYAVLSIDQQPDGLAALRELLPTSDYREIAFESCPDDNATIRKHLRTLVDARGINLIFTIGGCVVGVKERVPEVTLEVVERQIPGLAELMRLAGIQKSRRAALWRCVVGWKNKSLVINLPSQDTRVAIEAIVPVLPLTVSSIRGA